MMQKGVTLVQCLKFLYKLMINYNSASFVYLGVMKLIFQFLLTVIVISAKTNINKNPG